MESIRATYLLEIQTEPFERALELLLADMTCGIQYVSTRSGIKMDKICDSVPFVDDSVRGEILSVEKAEDGLHRVRIGVPASNIDVSLGGITNLLPIFAGEVFNFHFIKRAALTDLELPRSFEERYLGPRFGAPGVRALLGVERAPLFGTIMKPNVGLDPGRAAAAAGHLARAGFDFIKDDEVCVSPALCPLESRVREIARAVDRASQAAGRKILYAANVTTDFDTLGKAAETAIAAGAGGLMIDPFCAGLSSVDFLRRRFPVPLYAHRVGYGLFCLGQNYRVSFEVFSRLFRLFGVDFSHVGGIWGVSESSRKKTAGYLDALRRGSSKKPVWPVITGISLENMREYHEFYGDDAMYMDHNDIYLDEGRAKEKLTALKKEISS